MTLRSAISPHPSSQERGEEEEEDPTNEENPLNRFHDLTPFRF